MHAKTWEGPRTRGPGCSPTSMNLQLAGRIDRTARTRPSRPDSSAFSRPTLYTAQLYISDVIKDVQYYCSILVIYITTASLLQSSTIRSWR